MKPDADKKASALALRSAAEAKFDIRLATQPSTLNGPALLLELQVHQIELEMQNETLRLSQQALEASRDSYVELYEFAPVGYLTLSTEGLIAEINLTGVTLLGQERSKLIHKRFHSLLAKADQDRWTLHFRAALKNKSVSNIQLAMLRGDGSELLVHLTSALHPSPNKKDELRLTLTDISEQNRLAEVAEQLKQEVLQQGMEIAEHLRLIVDASPVAMVVVNDAGVIILANAEMSNIFGYTKGELSMQAIGLLLPQELRPAHTQNMADFISDAPTSRSMGTGKALFGQHKNGNKIPLDIGLNPFRAENKTYVIATIVDLTQRLRAEKEKLKLQAQLMQATKMESIGHLTAGVAHDFNNILGAMMGYVELSKVLINAGKTQDIDRHLTEVLTSGNRAKELIQQMLLFSRAGKSSDLAEAPVTLLAPVIKEVVSLLHSSIASSIELKYEILEPELKAKIPAVNLHQILLNLSVNARDAMGEFGKINITLSRQHCVNKVCSSCKNNFDGDYAQISVKDSGSGIPAESLSHIFDPFYTTKEVGKGTGMGLSVVHGLVHTQHGHIIVESSADSGTTFNILLPLSSVVEEVPVIAAATRVAGSLKGARIMVVDDEPLLANMLNDYLSMHDAQVQTFTDATLALQAYTRNPGSIDLVISDETMPAMSGMILSQHLLKITPKLPIILCTGYSARATPEAASASGIAAFFHKPVNMNELILKIQTLLKADS